MGEQITMTECAAMLDAVARGAESVDASVPILCGMAAHQLWVAGPGEAIILQIIDDPTAIAAFLAAVVDALYGMPANAATERALRLIWSVQRELGCVA